MFKLENFKIFRDTIEEKTENKLFKDTKRISKLLRENIKVTKRKY